MLMRAVTLLAGDTARSRCYMQALAGIGILPEQCVLLPSPDGKRPGQCAAGEQKSALGSWGAFFPGVPLEQTCRDADVPVTFAPTGDINDAEVVSLLNGIKAETFLYSGFGGAILRGPVLACGKRFLHVHGGWLPDYKGSTTNHYSILEGNFCGASAIFLTDVIDSGRILHRARFPAPEDVTELDLVLDSIYRAEVLCALARHYAAYGEWPDSGVENVHSEPYYIMHPVLRHILMLGGRRGGG
ncbi:methionyl-tRNA formyltransferase [Nitratidesulfovibrio sp. HK-II]|jgi:methionyl-tRNA formyltransferase|uniref:formyltransferase family protein n=1 Tax=Nitratidesulfovibrio sp. HK-II TaxID=2009266 RepID=UPI000E2FE532|nr:formyltransferase family protein [Nitratidesulfovibrio sp. HK-II]GBO97675.1 hypothetical protein RVX_2714 [Nitratidesulfovibrio sp. HK-II]